MDMLVLVLTLVVCVQGVYVVYLHRARNEDAVSSRSHAEWLLDEGDAYGVRCWKQGVKESGMAYRVISGLAGTDRFMSTLHNAYRVEGFAPSIIEEAEALKNAPYDYADEESA